MGDTQRTIRPTNRHPASSGSFVNLYGLNGLGRLFNACNPPAIDASARESWSSPIKNEMLFRYNKDIALDHQNLYCGRESDRLLRSGITVHFSRTAFSASPSILPEFRSALLPANVKRLLARGETNRWTHWSELLEPTIGAEPGHIPIAQFALCRTIQVKILQFFRYLPAAKCSFSNIF
jgi:hypothetical protein